MSRQLSQRELARLQRAIFAKSGGCLRLDRSAFSDTQATMLWHGLCRIFAATERKALDQPRRLSEFEQARFRRAIDAQWRGLIICVTTPLPVGQARAIWDLVCAIGHLDAAETTTPRHARATAAAALLVASLPLAACATLLGGNVKGSFSCSAPGGTCAPSTVIDDSALALIQNARPMTPAARPWSQPPLRGDGKVIAVADGVAHRERRVLKVVFPAFVDQRGYLHEPRIVHAVADQGGWMQTAARTEIPDLAQARLPVAPIDSNAAAALPVSHGAPESPAFAASQPAPLMGGGDVLPDPAKVAAARALGKARLPTTPSEIRAAVDARLSAAPIKAAAGISDAVGGAVTNTALPVVDQTGIPRAQEAGTKPAPDKPTPVNRPASFAGPEE